MAQSLANFQSELISKIQYKGSSKVSPDAFLIKCFKFFDLYNTGSLTKADFFKAAAKCGVVIDTHVNHSHQGQDMQTVFDYYDPDRTGKIDYRKFVEELLFSPKPLAQSQQQNYASGAPNINDSALRQSNHSQPTYQENRNIQPLAQSKIQRLYQQCDTFADVCDCLRREIPKTGLYGLIQLASRFKEQDPQKSHLISKAGLKNCLPFLSDRSFDIILQQFSKTQGDTKVNYAQVIYALKGTLDPHRESLVDNYFQILDDGRKEFQMIQMTQKCNGLPEEQELLRAVQLYCQFQGIDDGVFTDEDFLDFWGFVSYCVPNISDFALLLKSIFEDDARSRGSQRSQRSREFKPRSTKEIPTFDETIEGNFKKDKYIDNQINDPEVNASKSDRYSQASKPSQALVAVKEVELIILRVKRRLATKGTKGFLQFEKSNKSNDTDKDGLLSFEQFKKVIQDNRIDITPTEAALVFEVFDQEGTGYLNYRELVQTVKGDIPEVRNILMGRLWDQVKLNQHETSLSNIRVHLNFRGHPQVHSARRHEEQILRELQDTIMLIQDLNESPRQDIISKKEFMEYLQSLSLSIPDDKLFESTLVNFWRLQLGAKIEEQYAGSRKIFDPSTKGYLMDHHRYAVMGGSVSQNAPFGTYTEPTNYITEHKRI